MIRLVNFTCPEAGERASAFVPRWREDDVADRYHEVLCPACGWFHSVDPENGRVVDATESE
jgi:hypothetical protein